MPAWEILAHRIVVVAADHAGPHVARSAVGPICSAFSVIADSSSRCCSRRSLLAVNWLLYIYATVTNRVTEASLGYYMMPLVNAALATVFLKEKLRPAHYPALALVAMGVAIPFVAAGTFTWIAVALPITFGLYGLVRKTAPVESMTGLTVETLLMLPPSLGLPDLPVGDRPEPYGDQLGAERADRVQRHRDGRPAADIHALAPPACRCWRSASCSSFRRRCRCSSR